MRAAECEVHAYERSSENSTGRRVAGRRDDKLELLRRYRATLPSHVSVLDAILSLDMRISQLGAGAPVEQRAKARDEWVRDVVEAFERGTGAPYERLPKSVNKRDELCGR